MGTTVFMLAGLLPEVAGDLGIDLGRAGLLITAFAVGMIIGPPVMVPASTMSRRRAAICVEGRRFGMPSGTGVDRRIFLTGNHSASLLASARWADWLGCGTLRWRIKARM
ncbi:hypothetical protein NN3_13250 [Nocardia neocaledoniensis NBRC 108232]|uniref:Major facilitator superfamily (MFS) profile domain-containing protein n=1 Tax=Nocardia neocaledoniensis TaxID=236511 RepID=A0A317N7A5_9NOCA|nr:hypothetical protein DFR69_1119 [Nocardia neocaledoniensis]GEM30318.1 hypothetical protein NN3_13250 [Nocardia neocaledoniensis NBRC 108232]